VGNSYAFGFKVLRQIQSLKACCKYFTWDGILDDYMEGGPDTSLLTIIYEINFNVLTRLKLRFLMSFLVLIA